jgi:hypothetical protein
MYLRALRERQVNAVACDLSPGMLRRAGHPALVNADVTALPATWPPSSAGNTSSAAKLPCLVASMPNSMPGMMSGMVIS